MKKIRCYLKPEKEKPLEGFHPWVFSGAIDRIDDDYKTGDIVTVYSAQEKFLGLGYLNPRSQIAIRMLAFEETEINRGFFVRKIQKAIRLRDRFVPADTDAYRLIHSEGDDLSGLVVDRYGDFLVAQFSTAGMEQWKDMIVDILKEEIMVRGIFEKDDTEAREWEGLPARVGKLSGEDPPDFIEITEYGHKFIVDIHQGQKTGFYLDQRDNRRLVGSVSHGKRVLNCFSYTGGFSVYAAAGGALETISVDSSQPALNTALNNFQKNSFSTAQNTIACTDVFQYLRDSRQEFDMIVLDPPSFCKGKQHINQASRGYKDINMYALKRLAPGGLLYTASCSSYIDPDLFQKIVFAAAKDVRRGLQIIAKTSHPFDHPINIYHPEGEYLKGFLCLVE